MNGSLYTSKTALQAQELSLQYISNNIANMKTTAYKATRGEFSELMAVKIREASPAEGSATGGLQVGTGVKAVGTLTDFKQGQPILTNRELDVMIQGDGFFKVTNADGQEFYTRKGAFIVNEDGKLSTVDNYVLDPEIEIPDNTKNILFEKDGRVVAITPDAVEGEEVGQMELYKFINPNGLRQTDGGMYEITESSGDEISGEPEEDGFGNILQNYLEGSNVDGVTEMVNLISAQRGYEMASKSLNASNEIMKTLNNSVS